MGADDDNHEETKEDRASIEHVLALEPCLICSSLRIIPISSVSHENPFPGGNTSINSSLWALFVLRELLEYPKENCEGILLKSGGLDPCQWFTVCSQCLELVREALTIYHQILELKQNLEKVKAQVSMKMKESFIYDNENEGGDIDMFCARKDIRQFYRSLLSCLNVCFPKEEVNVESMDSDSDESAVPLPLAFDFKDNDNLSDNGATPASGCDNDDWDASEYEGENCMETESSEEDDDESEDGPSSSGNCEEDNPYSSPEYVVPNSPLDINIEDESTCDESKVVGDGSSNEATQSKAEAPRVKYGKRTKYKCPSCSATFVKKTVCKFHILLRHAFPELPELEKQDSDDTLESGPFLCVLCNHQYSTIDRIIRHLEDHLRFKRTTCDICKYPAESKRKLKYHHKVVHKQTSHPLESDSGSDDDEEDPSFNPGGTPSKNCKPLEIHRISMKSSRPKHYRISNLGPPRNGRYECPSCPTTFQKRAIRRLHVLLRHTFPQIPDEEKEKQDSDDLENGPFSCVICQSVYSNVDRLTRHLESHQKTRETSFKSAGSRRKRHDAHSTLASKANQDEDDDADSDSEDEQVETMNLPTLPLSPKIMRSKKCKKRLKNKDRITSHSTRSMVGGPRRHGKYDCPSCPLSFLKRAVRRLHILMRHTFSEIPEEEKCKQDSDDLEIGPISCVVCKRSYSNMDRATSHLEDHLKYASSSCQICKYPARSLKILQHHHKVNHKDADSDSTMLEKVAADEEGMGNPSDSKHGSLKTSGKSGEDEMRKHKESMAKVSAARYASSYHYKCVKEDCDFECNHPRYKFRHIQGHKFNDNMTEISATEFHCKLCRGQFKVKSQMTLHLRSEHGKELNLSACQTCSRCGRQFHDISYLNAHVNKVHLKNFRHHCGTCGMGFMVPNALARHKVTHMKDMGNPEVCNICGKGFKTLDSLNSHKRQLHRKEVLLEAEKDLKTELRRKKCLEKGKQWCAHCAEGVTDIRNHLRQVHTDLYQFSCELCGEMYQGLTALNTHKEAAHSGGQKEENAKWYLKRGKLSDYYEERAANDFKCKICNLGFKIRKKICKHLLASHAEEIKVRGLSQCHICGERYTEAAQVRYHITTAHKKSSDFYCDECGQGFMRKSLLEEHKEKHAQKIDMKVKSVECGLCEKVFAWRKTMWSHRWKVHGVRKGDQTTEKVKGEEDPV